ncbi:MAG: DeoR/GlpR transcriptional regulator [Lachnospiraceae bacterium]|nr:DeoR/GlpR transcriptional regulator [Lachnospiraceae bacterium]
MLTEERLQRILELVERYQSISTRQLTEKLGISESTVRRDLALLDGQGTVKKVRGGVMVIGSRYKAKDDAVSLRKERNPEEKERIARYAASLIKPDDFVYLDAGTTTERMIEYLTEKQAVFVTNAVSHAKRLSEAGYTVYLPGGEFKAATEALVGEEAVESLQKYNFTKGFWGTNSVSKEEGFCTPDVREAMIKKTSMSRCAKCYVLCDSSKFSQISCVKFGDFVNADIITTKVTGKEFVHCSNIVEVDAIKASHIM